MDDHVSADLEDSNLPPKSVGDTLGDASMTKLWQDHFSTFLNSVQNKGSKPFECESIDRDMHNEDTIVITAPDVRECLKTNWVKLLVLMGWLLNILFFAQYYVCIFIFIIYKYVNCLYL